MAAELPKVELEGILDNLINSALEIPEPDHEKIVELIENELDCEIRTKLLAYLLREWVDCFVFK